MERDCKKFLICNQNGSNMEVACWKSRLGGKMKLYEMKLGETTDFGPFEVMRVPGGWLFIRYHLQMTSQVFVPFNNEFQKMEEPKNE